MEIPSSYESEYNTDWNYHRQAAEETNMNDNKLQINLDDLVSVLLNSPKILIVSGYANSGKSSLLQDLREEGIESFSTSQICHDLLDLAAGEKVQTKIDSNRTRMINFVENGLIKVFGRIALANAVAHSAWSHWMQSGESVVIETIGGLEYQYLLDFLDWQDLPEGMIITLNCRATAEQPGIDIRELINEPGTLEYWWQQDFSRKK